MHRKSCVHECDRLHLRPRSHSENVARYFLALGAVASAARLLPVAVIAVPERRLMVDDIALPSLTAGECGAACPAILASIACSAPICPSSAMSPQLRRPPETALTTSSGQSCCDEMPVKGHVLSSFYARSRPLVRRPSRGDRRRVLVAGIGRVGLSLEGEGEWCWRSWYRSDGRAVGPPEIHDQRLDCCRP
jgi:hypothetical protein